MPDFARISGRTYQWRLSFRTFHRAEYVYGYQFKASELMYITPGNLPVLVWVGALQHEIKTGEQSPSLDDVLDWAEQVPGLFSEFSSDCIEAINRMWIPEDEKGSQEPASDPDAPFSTGGGSATSLQSTSESEPVSGI